MSNKKDTNRPFQFVSNRCSIKTSANIGLQPDRSNQDLGQDHEIAIGLVIPELMRTMKRNVTQHAALIIFFGRLSSKFESNGLKSRV